MEDFKRFYSNNDVDKSIPYFWEKFDPENYSIWLGEYKYNSELTKVFMSCNLIAGMYQRLDKMRKNAVASRCLFGEATTARLIMKHTAGPSWTPNPQKPRTWSKMTSLEMEQIRKVTSLIKEKS